MRRILSIDGGGIKGVFPASFLATMEDSIGDSIANYFDLIVGTSTGGIIALGLGLGFTANEMLNFYEDYGPNIFKGNRIFRKFWQLGFSKYKAQGLRTALEAKFKDKSLGESIKRLVIPALNLETGEVHIYKTSHHPRLQIDYKEKVVDVALATAAAPTFFPAFRSVSGIPLIDGGMWANNPVGMAVVEAIAVLNWPRNSLKVLSLGCTTEPLNVNWGRKWSLGSGYWSLKIADVFITAQSSASYGTAQLLANHENVFRVSPIVEKGRFGLDVVKEIESLKGLGYSEARQHLPSLREQFFIEIAEEFVPFNKLEDS